MTSGAQPYNARRRILVVDEHRGSRLVMCHRLTSRGFVVRAASTPDDAIEAIGTFRPDVVLLEWIFRGTGGFDVARKLRREGEKLAISFLLIATSTQDEPEGFRAAEDCDGYLVKPIVVADLDQLLRGHS